MSEEIGQLIHPSLNKKNKKPLIKDLKIFLKPLNQRLLALLLLFPMHLVLLHTSRESDVAAVPRC